MPYAIRKKGKKYQVVKKSDGKIMGTHSNRPAALKQLAALYANEDK